MNTPLTSRRLLIFTVRMNLFSMFTLCNAWLSREILPDKKICRFVFGGKLKVGEVIFIGEPIPRKFQLI